MRCQLPSEYAQKRMLKKDIELVTFIDALTKI